MKKLRFLTLALTTTIGCGAVISQSSCSNPDETWTIMMYVCGSDFEAIQDVPEGLASNQIHKALMANFSSRMHIIVETGGSDTAWKTNWAGAPTISTSTLQRWEIINHQLVWIANETSNDMTASSSLQNFMEWSIQNRPAQHYGFMFFDHGFAWQGCEKDMNSSKQLTLKSMDTAFSNVVTTNLDNKKFDFICFDNCLMANLENLAVNYKYANYIIANEDEGVYANSDFTGCGLDYQSFFEYIDQYSWRSPYWYGRQLITTLNARQTAHDKSACATLIDCQYVPKLLNDFNTWCDDIEYVKVSLVEAAAREAANFNKENVYNLIDFYDWMSFFNGHSYNADIIVNDLNWVIAYHQHNINADKPFYTNVHGINIYFPRNNNNTDNEILSYLSACDDISSLGHWYSLLSFWYDPI